MAESAGDNGDVAVLVKWAGELLLGQGISAKKGFATLAGDGVEVVPQRLVPAHRAVFRRRHFDRDQASASRAGGQAAQLSIRPLIDFLIGSSGGGAAATAAAGGALGGWRFICSGVACVGGQELLESKQLWNLATAFYDFQRYPRYGSRIAHSFRGPQHAEFGRSRYHHIF